MSKTHFRDTVLLSYILKGKIVLIKVVPISLFDTEAEAGWPVPIVLLTFTSLVCPLVLLKPSKQEPLGSYEVTIKN